MLGLAAPSGAGRPAPPLELWLYERADLSDAAQVRDVERVWRRAAHAGYRHVVLADAGGARSAAAEREVSRRIGRLRALASSIHLEVVPEVFELKSNSFEIEWPPRSGKLKQFPEIDRAEFFRGEVALRKMNPAQAPFLDRLLAALHRTEEK